MGVRPQEHFVIIGKIPWTFNWFMDKRSDISSCMLDFCINFQADLTFSYSQRISGLEIQPKPGAVAKITGKS